MATKYLLDSDKITPTEKQGDKYLYKIKGIKGIWKIDEKFQPTHDQYSQGKNIKMIRVRSH